MSNLPNLIDEADDHIGEWALIVGNEVKAYNPRPGPLMELAKDIPDAVIDKVRPKGAVYLL